MLRQFHANEDIRPRYLIEAYNVAKTPVAKARIGADIVQDLETMLEEEENCHSSYVHTKTSTLELRFHLARIAVEHLQATKDQNNFSRLEKTLTSDLSYSTHMTHQARFEP